MTLENRPDRRPRCRGRGLAVLTAAAAAAGGMAALPSASWGQSALVVDGGNSPYTSTGTATYSRITVGNVSTGVLAQTGGTLTCTGRVSVGNTAGGVGTYNLSNSAALVASGSGGGLIVGNSGTGTLNAFNASGVNLGRNEFDLGGSASGRGALTIGDSAAVTAGALVVGKYGAGTVGQTGGTVTLDGGLYVGGNAGATGTYTLAGGAVTADAGDVGYGGVGTFNQTGGTCNLSSSSYAAVVGENPGAVGTVKLSGTGLFESNIEVVGDSGVGTFNQAGGTHTVTGFLAIGYETGGTGTYQLGGGILQTPSVTGAGGASGTTSTFNFSGGTLRATASSTTFFQDLTTANVGVGGAIVDTQAYAVSIAQPLLHQSSLGPTVDGGLTKAGTGTLTLTGSSTYTGPTTVSAGTLRANNAAGSATGTGLTSVMSGATLGGNGSVGAVAVGGGGTITAGATAAAVGTLTTGPLTLGQFATVQAKFTAAGTANDELVLSGLTVTADPLDTVTVTLSGLGGPASPTRLAAGTYVLAQDKGDAAGVFRALVASGTFVLTTTNVSAGGGGGSLTLAEVDGSGYEDLVLVAAPEPTSLLLAAAAAAPLAVGRRRRCGRR